MEDECMSQKRESPLAERNDVGGGAKPGRSSVGDRPGSLWRNHDFVRLWSGRAVASRGTQISLLAFPLLIFALTGSPVQAGLMTALRGLPYVLLSLPAGALVG
jgi:hypothetical protein